MGDMGRLCNRRVGFLIRMTAKVSVGQRGLQLSVAGVELEKAEV